jgi:mannose-6-phosphate isomerase
VRAGDSLSLQFHNRKDESWYVQQGRAELELAAAGEGITETEVVSPGAAFRFRPGTVHRLTAIEDTVVLEVSTPELDDVVRLQDAYGRQGEPPA